MTRVTQLELRQERLVNELASLRARVGGITRVAASPVVPDAAVAIGDLPAIGVTSRLVLIEYSDFQCPFCRRYFAETFPQIQRDYVQSGKLGYVFHNMPLVGLHPEAVNAAAAGVCAQQQGRFWDLHRALFSKPGPFTEQVLVARAEEVGLDTAAYNICMSKRGPEAVRSQAQDAESLGIQGTPAFLIGELGSDGIVKVKRRIQGAQPYSVFQGVLDQLIAGG